MKKVFMGMFMSLLLFIWASGNVFSASRPSDWENAKGPNYKTNKELNYPYSDWSWSSINKEKSIKKLGVNGKIKLIDFWGEGRIKYDKTIAGFPGAYNINHQYQLVSSGPDVNKKIPNRIPVSKYDGFAEELQTLVANDSVFAITIMNSPINEDCASEIARMIDKKNGIVIFYGNEKSSNKNLSKAMHKIGMRDFRDAFPENFKSLDTFGEVSFNINRIYLAPAEMYRIATTKISTTPPDALVKAINALDKFGFQSYSSSLRSEIKKYPQKHKEVENILKEQAHKNQKKAVIKKEL